MKSTRMEGASRSPNGLRTATTPPPPGNLLCRPPVVKVFPGTESALAWSLNRLIHFPPWRPMPKAPHIAPPFPSQLDEEGQIPCGEGCAYGVRCVFSTHGCRVVCPRGEGATPLNPCRHSLDDEAEFLDQHRLAPRLGQRLGRGQALTCTHLGPLMGVSAPLTARCEPLL